VLLSACISGGGLYVLSVQATPEQWTRNGGGALVEITYVESASDCSA